MQLFSGRSFVSNTWELGTPGYDGKGTGSIATAHVEKSRVCAVRGF